MFNFFGGPKKDENDDDSSHEGSETNPEEGTDEDPTPEPAPISYDPTDGIGVSEPSLVPETTVVYDLRCGSLPSAVEVFGEHIFETLEDGSTVLFLGSMAWMKVSLPESFRGNQGGERINSYTLTMDIRVPELPPDGISLFQAAYPSPHNSDEATLSCIGTVGAFDQFDGEPIFKVGKWNRISITVGGNFGQAEHQSRMFCSYINGKKCLSIREPMWGYNKDTRFSVDPKGFILFASRDLQCMPGGVAVKYIKFSAQAADAATILQTNRVDSIFSQFAKSAAAQAEAIKKALTLSVFSKHPHPIWLDPIFISAFSDPYVEGTGLGESESYFGISQLLHYAFCSMMKEQASWLEENLLPADLALLQRSISHLARSIPLARRFNLAQRGPPQLVAFLAFKTKLLDALADGESLYFPAGFNIPKVGHAHMLLEVVRQRKDHWQLVVVNVGPFGLNYHPCLSDPPKIKYKTCILMDGIPYERITDDSWWIYVFTSTLYAGAGAEGMYCHLLPYLGQSTFEHHAAASAAQLSNPHRTLPRTGLSIYRLFVDAMFFGWLREGMNIAKAKFILFNLRRQLIKFAIHDLNTVRNVTDSDQRVLRIASEQLCRVAVKQSVRYKTSIDHLRLTKADAFQLAQLVEEKAVAPSDNILAPPQLNLDPTMDASTQFYTSPCMERLLRKEDTDGLVGARTPIPKFVPINFLRIPEKVTDFEGALAALRYADRLCTLISVQKSSVKNSQFLKCALLQHVFTQVVPVPAGPGSPHACIWATPLRYGVQLDILILLQRLMEHFASSVFSVQTSKSFDAVRIVVSGAMVAIADCVMRKIATDQPSEVCATLINSSYGVGIGEFGSQSETIEVIAPEVNLTRTAVLDYFSRLSVRKEFFSWERSMRMEPTLSSYLREVCEQLAFPPLFVDFMTDSHALLIKNYPEFACYRDVCFYWKFFMNTKQFPSVPEGDVYTQRHAELEWGFNEGEFIVRAFEMFLPAEAKGHRWASGAAPSRYTAPVRIFTEDDLLHIHSFTCFEKTLTQKDIELLLSFLTVPYMRIPLVLNFFATADRIHTLRDRQLRALVDSVVFEPSRYLQIGGSYAPTLVPSEDPALIASPYGILLNELHRSPTGLIGTVLTLVQQARKMDVGTVFSTTVGVILYVIRLITRIESAMSMLLSVATGSHPTITIPLRDVELDQGTIEVLTEGLNVLDDLLRHGSNSIQVLLEAWLVEVLEKMKAAAADPEEDDEIEGLLSDAEESDDELEDAQAGGNADKKQPKSGGSSKMDRNTRIACRLYSHIIIMYRNLTASQLQLHDVTSLLTAFYFMQTRHTWNHQLLDIPETELYDAMQIQRRNVIRWFDTVASPSERSHALEAIVRVTTATGVRVASSGDVVRSWDFILGTQHCGRFTIASKVTTVIQIESVEQFQACIAGNSKVCIDFYATWCGPCRAIAPVVKLMAQQIPGVAFFKVDVDRVPQLVQQLGVTAMPTFKLFHRGTETASLVGASPVDLRSVVERLNNVIESGGPHSVSSAPRTGVSPDDIKEEEINLQIHVLHLKSNHLRALEDHVQADVDVQTVFQTNLSMQCAVLESAENRDWFRLIGRFHDIQYWKTPDRQVPLQENDREYEPGCVGAHEGWAVSLFEPVRLTYFNDPMNPIEFVLPEQELPPTATVCYIVGLHPQRGGTWKEVFVFKDYAAVHVYDVVSFGRRHYRSLCYTTDARFTLRDMQPSPGPRQAPWPSWCRHGAGDPTADYDPGISAVILRDMQAKGNVSGTLEQFIPGRLLYGIVPSALVDSHYFWQNATDNVIGYPKDDTATHHLHIAFQEDVPHAAVPAMPSHCLAQIKRVPQVSQQAEAISAGKHANAPIVDSDEMQLVNLMMAPRGTALHSLARCLARIENLSYILVWTKDAIAASQLPSNDLRISLVQLPRLKLTFAPKVGADGVSRLYSVDHVDLFISNDRDPLVVKLLRGIPHSLVLSTVNREYTILVPSIRPVRPRIESSPFSCELVLDRLTCMGTQWRMNLATPYYLYPVHVSLSFLNTPTLASALYLLLLRFSFRNYNDVVRLVDTIATDADFSKQAEELQIFTFLGSLNNDGNPNAHAARLKISVVMVDSPVSCPWELDFEFAKLVNKNAHVLATTQLSIHDVLLCCEECEAIERKQEIVCAIIEEYGVKEVVKLLGSVIDEEAALEVTFQEKKRIDAFFQGIQDKIYKQIRRRVRVEEVIALIKRVLRNVVLPEFLACLWKNLKSYTEAFTQNEKTATVQLPARKKESQWYLTHLHRATRAQKSDWKLIVLNDKEMRGVSGHAVVEVMQALYSGKTDSLGGTTGFSFVFFYGLLTGTTKFKLGNCRDARSFVALSLPLLGDFGDTLLVSILHIMVWNPSAIQSFPQWHDTRKSKSPTITCEIEEGDKSAPLDILLQGAVSAIKSITRRMAIPQDPSCFLRLPKPPAAVDVPDNSAFQLSVSTNFPHGSLKLPTDQSGYNPVVFNTALSRLYIEECAETAEFLSAPLGLLGLDTIVVWKPRPEKVSDQLPFDVVGHPFADSHISRKMIERFQDEVKEFASSNNSQAVPKINGLLDEEIDAGSFKQETILAQLHSLEKRLVDLRNADAARVTEYIGKVLSIANSVASDAPEATEQDIRAMLSFELRRYCGLESAAWIEYLVASLISDVGSLEWRKLNPYLADADFTAGTNLLVRMLLHANRVGHANRALLELRDLLRLLQAPAAAMSSTKHCAAMKQKADALAGVLTVRRHYVERDEKNRPFLDPRFLLFEFSWNLLLRESQVAMVRSFMSELDSGRSSVWQMIMGAGKTTVVGPLLALLLATGKQLVMQVVPPALLEFSRGVMRSTFSSIIKKRIFTFLYDRSTECDPMLYRKLLNAQRTAGVVVTNPTSIKSLMLKYIEYLVQISDRTRPRVREMEENAQELGRVLQLFRSGVLMIDEVDLILHPLKSELNFPIGAKEPMDFSPLRWTLPIHILDSIFFASRGRMSVDFKESTLAAKVLAKIQRVVLLGYKTRSLQANPHIVLLDSAFYHEKLKPLIAEWTLLWMEQHSFAGISQQQTLEYLLCGSVVPNHLKAAVSSSVSYRNKQMLNLAHDWLRSYLPHILMKIDRVTFGIMSKADRRRAILSTPNMPRSRLMLAIPFVGKDVPSDASEFAHPDIIIGLTILAYRYEGVRYSDFKDILATIRETVLKEQGPWHERQTNIRYESWVCEAGGRVRGQVDYRPMTAVFSPDEEQAEQGSLQPAVISLRLLQHSSREQVLELFRLLRRLPDMIHWYLNEIIFPTYMRFQQLKLSASGQDIGGDMLFPRRVGFSGTPSDLLPVELGRCHYEAGSDGLIINTLIDPNVVAYSIVPQEWKPKSLLDQIAQENRFHVLIDTGALITGLTNYEVARYLLDAGLEGKKGVVFLDDQDRKMILVRATGRVLQLDECGIPLEERFAFYDQIHTTGMDIKHTPNAIAGMTLGKDMTFRDYAQGAFRMRGIARGQKIHLLITPELRELMIRELKAAKHPITEPPQLVPLLREVTAWLVINSMGSERLQFSQLCLQNVANVYRKNGFRNLLKGSSRFKIDVDVRSDHCLGPSLELFHEPVEFNLEACVPEPCNFSETITALVRGKSSFIATEEDASVVENVQQKVAGIVESQQERAFNQDMVREQEEEKEKRKEIVEEKELEITQFKDQQYARDQEEPTPWMFCLLSSPDDALTTGTPEVEPATFYRAKEFRLFARQPIQFPEYMLISNNYFDKRWSGYRRVKNVIVVMDWIVDRSALVPRASPCACAPTVHRLDRTFDLLAKPGETTISSASLKSLLNTCFETDVDDCVLSQLTKGDAVGYPAVEEILRSGRFRQEQENRFAVCLSLIEAETIRRIMHVKRREELIEGSKTDMALRVVPTENYIMDRSVRYVDPPSYQAEVEWNCFRFIDCETHFRDAHVNFLLKGIQMNAMFERRLFFEQIMGCKRRNQMNWQQTPVSRVFKILSEYVMLHLRILALRVKNLVAQKELLPYDAFQTFDHAKLGSLSPGNILAALRWLGLSPSHDDVLDYVAMASPKGDGRVSYSEWLDMMRESSIASGLQSKQSVSSILEEERTTSTDSMFAESTRAGTIMKVVSDRLPPIDEDVFMAMLAQREAEQEELKRQNEARLRAEELGLRKAIREYRREVQKKRGQDDNPGVLGNVLRFDLSTGFLPDEVTMIGYTYYEPDANPARKRLHCDVESAVVLPIGAYGLDWAVSPLNVYSVHMYLMLTQPIPGEGSPLLQLARHRPDGACLSAKSHGIVAIEDLDCDPIAVDTPAVWEYMDPSSGGYTPYHQEHQKQLESKYRHDPNSTEAITVFGVGVIVVNFRSMKQRNMSTGGERPVKRTQDASGARITIHKLHLITLSVNLPARIIQTFVDGLLSAQHSLKESFLDGPFSVHPEHQLFLFGHRERTRMLGGAVAWVSVTPTSTSAEMARAMFEQQCAVSEWVCACCSSINHPSDSMCHVCEQERKEASYQYEPRGPPRQQRPQTWDCDCGYRGNPPDAIICEFCQCVRGTTFH